VCEEVANALAGEDLVVRSAELDDASYAALAAYRRAQVGESGGEVVASGRNGELEV
jgi:hypothetical protein